MSFTNFLGVKMIRKALFFFTVALLALTILALAARKGEEVGWGNLKNLGPNINSPGKDEHPTFTPSGKTMYFASIREGGRGGYDLYLSEFKNGEWSKARLLPAPLNTPRDDFDPFL